MTARPEQDVKLLVATPRLLKNNRRGSAQFDSAN